MKKMRSLSLSMLAATAMLVAGCTPAEETAQGVTDTTIKIGNTAATTGALAAVGIPFNVGLQAVLEEVNDAGGIDGREIEFLHYDDEFNAAKGLQYTETLVEDDEVFALVGHFGTPTVGATIDYIQDMGVPMVYAATGINDLYFQRTPGNPVMAVQPIYKTEGRILLARAFEETDLFGTVAKVGVIYTADDAGLSIKAGVDVQALDMGKTANVVSTVGSGDFSAAVLALAAAEVDAVIVATNQAYFGAALNAMAAGNLNVPVLTSYVSANTYYIPAASVSVDRPVYTNAWVDITSAGVADELEDFYATIDAYSAITTEEKAGYKLNSFAIAGYIAGKIFVEGLQRVADEDEVLNWENFIAAMESEVIDFPLGGGVDFTDGKRWGVDSLSLLKYQAAEGTTPATLVMAKPVETLEEILG